MTRLELRSALRRLIRNRTELDDTALNTSLMDAYRRLCRGRFKDQDRTAREVVLFFPEMVKVETSNFGTGGATYTAPNPVGFAWDYPATAEAILYLTVITGAYGVKRLTAIPPERMDDHLSETGPPRFYTAIDSLRRIYLSPQYGSEIDTTADKKTLVYYARPDALASDADSPVIAECYHSLIPLLAARDLCNEFGEDERATALTQQFYARLNEVIPTRWLTSAFRAFNAQITRG